MSDAPIVYLPDRIRTCSFMDSDTVIPENGHEAVHQNGAQDESILNNADKVSDIAFLNGSLESVKLDVHGMKSSHDALRVPQVDD